MDNLGRTRTRRRVRIPAIAAGLALVALATACASKPTVNVTTPQAISSGGVDAGITVTGSGDVNGTPDTLTASFGILTVRPSVSQAVAADAALAATVTNTVKAKGVPPADIQTENYSVYPSFTTIHGRTVPNGYTVGESLVVDLHDLPAAGGVIDAVVAAGGNNVSVQGVSFSLENNQKLLAMARAKAWADAEAQAKQLSSLSGQHLGHTEGINATVTPFDFPVGKSALADSQAAAAPITNLEPGSVSTTVTLSVRFALD